MRSAHGHIVVSSVDRRGCTVERLLGTAYGSKSGAAAMSDPGVVDRTHVVMGSGEDPAGSACCHDAARRSVQAGGATRPLDLATPPYHDALGLGRRTKVCGSTLWSPNLGRKPWDHS